ncbi:MAG: hypothetical protein HQK83_15730 [Fibrobacteria bacterium]|nr:hypothetical protein [Fibrobacteria bacterium]
MIHLPTIFRSFFYLLFLSLSVICQETQEKEEKNTPKKMPEHLVFEATRIEGQLGTVKALIVTSERRPDFSPMALQLSDQSLEIKRLNKKIIEQSSYKKAFKVKFPK